MEDTAPEPVLVEQLTKLADEALALECIIGARSIEAGKQRWKPAAVLLNHVTQGLQRVAKLAADVAEKPPEGTRRGRFICTYTGRRFWPIDPMPDEVNERDIAMSLCQLPRWAGFMPGAFTVGEHSIRVARIARVLARHAGLSPELCDLAYLYGLLHDAHEAYIGDLTRPLKDSIPEWGGIAVRVQRAIEQYLGVQPMPIELEPLVEKADLIMLVLEAETGFTEFNPHAIVGWELPRLDDMGLSNVERLAVVQVAAMSETWPRSKVNNDLLNFMRDLRTKKLAADERAVVEAASNALVPHSGLRPLDPSENAAKYDKIATDLGADTAPVDLEEQLKRAELASAAKQRRA
jgi:5'-deoxynucleotidase YfbR-like HD superfamily hydrolase